MYKLNNENIFILQGVAAGESPEEAPGASLPARASAQAAVGEAESSPPPEFDFDADPSSSEGEAAGG